MRALLPPRKIRSEGQNEKHEKQEGEEDFSVHLGRYGTGARCHGSCVFSKEKRWGSFRVGGSVIRRRLAAGGIAGKASRL